jgi:excisionase family DNA binding protein
MISFNFPESQNNLIVEKYTTVQAAAQVSGYNVQYLRRLLRAGKLAGIKIGQVWLISLASLTAYIQQAEEAVDRRCGPKVNRIADVYTNVYESSLQMYTTNVYDYGKRSKP